ncbi:hypothetical protein DT065_15845 [Salicibibacter kimchii]|uniref:Uncharacterized protein n=2 Tax=Salicibibacter kimchii TaxID=2099786 RepID=A0A345C296_9BACI|nr:hypothetical protein DT065_15845 [Salicibibacter kimchii]
MIIDEISLFINKWLKKGRRWLSEFMNQADHTLSKASFLLQEKKKQIDDYLVDRNQLLAVIQKNRKEVDDLRAHITQLNDGKAFHLIDVYEQLEMRSSKLLDYQEKYMDVQKTIDEQHKQVQAVTKEKDRALIERDWLKTEYNHLKGTIQKKTLKLAALQNELQQLKDTQSGQDLIEQKEAEIVQLKKDRIIDEDKLSRLKRSHLDMIKKMGILNHELTDTKERLDEQQQAAKDLQDLIDMKKEEVEQSREETIAQKEKAEDAQEKMREYLLQFEKASNHSQTLQEALEEKEEEHSDMLWETDNKIKTLKNELLDTHNKLAIEKAHNGSPRALDTKALQTLEQEYEPRFKTLYHECFFHREFFSDFFSLSASDRLKVEACIARLNSHYDLHIGNVRPNTVKTRSVTLNEYPFGQDRAGRIYFRRDDNKVQFFRISRTKNGKGALDQKRVVAWLKKK